MKTATQARWRRSWRRGLLSAIFVILPWTANAAEPGSWTLCVLPTIERLDDLTSPADVVGRAAVDRCLGPSRSKWEQKLGAENLETVMNSFYRQASIAVLEHRAKQRRK